MRARALRRVSRELIYLINFLAKPSGSFKQQQHGEYTYTCACIWREKKTRTRSCVPVQYVHIDVILANNFCACTRQNDACQFRRFSDDKTGGGGGGKILLNNNVPVKKLRCVGNVSREFVWFFFIFRFPSVRFSRVRFLASSRPVIRAAESRQCIIHYACAYKTKIIITIRKTSTEPAASETLIEIY